MCSKDFKAKNRDVIEHYLEQQGPVLNTQRHEQDEVCNTSLSFLQKKCLLKFWANNLIIFKTSLCVLGTNPIRRDSFVRTDQSQTSLAGKYCEIRPIKDDFCKDFIRTGRGD